MFGFPYTLLVYENGVVLKLELSSSNLNAKGGIKSTPTHHEMFETSFYNLIFCVLYLFL